MGRFCDKCGNPISDNAAFCDKCGNPINNMQPNNVQQFIPNNVNMQTPKVKKKHGCLIGVGAFVCLCILVGIFGGGDDKPSTAERTVPQSTTTAVTTAKPTETTTTTTVSKQPEETKATEKPKQGFDEKTNITVKHGGLVYHIPSYFKEIETKNDKTIGYKYEENDGSFLYIEIGYLDSTNYSELNENIAKKLFSD